MIPAPQHTMPVEGESRAAYPVHLGHAEDSEPGIDTLAYFAARAPAEPQWHFEVVGLPPRPKILVPADKAGDGEAVWDGVMPPYEWDDLRFIQRRAQWPWVWARATLRARRTLDGASDFDSQAQCAEAWHAVVNLLNSLVPHWNQHPRTGMENALAAIRDLHEEARRQKEIAARERALDTIEAAKKGHP